MAREAGVGRARRAREHGVCSWSLLKRIGTTISRHVWQCVHVRGVSESGGNRTAAGHGTQALQERRRGTVEYLRAQSDAAAG